MRTFRGELKRVVNEFLEAKKREGCYSVSSLEIAKYVERELGRKLTRSEKMGIGRKLNAVYGVVKRGEVWEDGKRKFVIYYRIR